MGIAHVFSPRRRGSVCGARPLRVRAYLDISTNSDIPLRELQKIKPSKNPQAQAWGYTDKAVPARAKRALLGAIASKQG